MLTKYAIKPPKTSLQITHWIVVSGRLDQRSINRLCYGTIAFGH